MAKWQQMRERRNESEPYAKYWKQLTEIAYEKHHQPEGSRCNESNRME